MCSFCRSPLIVFGHPITFIFELAFAKYSAKKHASVFESSPPIITIPSKFSFEQLFSESLNCFSVSILCLPLPIHIQLFTCESKSSINSCKVVATLVLIKIKLTNYIKSSGVFKRFIQSSVISMQLFVKIPWGPLRNPNSQDSG